jgi:hypothetical protein
VFFFPSPSNGLFQRSRLLLVSARNLKVPYKQNQFRSLGSTSTLQRYSPIKHCIIFPSDNLAIGPATASSDKISLARFERHMKTAFPVSAISSNRRRCCSQKVDLFLADCVWISRFYVEFLTEPILTGSFSLCFQMGRRCRGSVSPRATTCSCPVGVRNGGQHIRLDPEWFLGGPVSANCGRLLASL